MLLAICTGSRALRVQVETLAARGQGCVLAKGGVYTVHATSWLQLDVCVDIVMKAGTHAST